MKLFKRLFHRHTWRLLRTEYRYRDYQTGNKMTVKRCQCRVCGKISYLHFNGKDIIGGCL